MPGHPDKLVTVLGSAYFQPIADLVERLIQRKRARPTRVQSTHHESGYAAAGVLLLVAMFESYISRVRFTQPKLVTDATRSAVDVVLSVFPKLRHRKALEEVYVLRDLLITVIFGKSNTNGVALCQWFSRVQNSTPHTETISFGDA